MRKIMKNHENNYIDNIEGLISDIYLTLNGCLQLPELPEVQLNQGQNHHDMIFLFQEEMFSFLMFSHSGWS